MKATDTSSTTERKTVRTTRFLPRRLSLNWENVSALGLWKPSVRDNSYTR